MTGHESRGFSDSVGMADRDGGDVGLAHSPPNRNGLGKRYRDAYAGLRFASRGLRITR